MVDHVQDLIHDVRETLPDELQDWSGWSELGNRLPDLGSIGDHLGDMGRALQQADPTHLQQWHDAAHRDLRDDQGRRRRSTRRSRSFERPLEPRRQRPRDLRGLLRFPSRWRRHLGSLRGSRCTLYDTPTVRLNLNSSRSNNASPFCWINARIMEDVPLLQKPRERSLNPPGLGLRFGLTVTGQERNIKVQEGECPSDKKTIFDCKNCALIVWARSLPEN